MRQAKYIETFNRSGGCITAFSPGHPFDARTGGVESDDEGMDRNAPRTVCVPTPAEGGLLVAMTADLHSNELRDYINLVPNGEDEIPERISLAAEGSLPGDIDLLIFAGDLGCSFNEELRDSGAFEDRQSSREDPKDTDTRHLRRWGTVLAALLGRHPKLQVVVVAGNHDGLLCTQRDCLTCGSLCAPGRHRWPLPPLPPLPRAANVVHNVSAAAAAAASVAASFKPEAGKNDLPVTSGRDRISPEVLAVLEEGLPAGALQRLHWLDHSYVDLDFGPCSLPPATPPPPPPPISSSNASEASFQLTPAAPEVAAAMGGECFEPWGVGRECRHHDGRDATGSGSFVVEAQPSSKSSSRNEPGGCGTKAGGKLDDDDGDGRVRGAGGVGCGVVSAPGCRRRRLRVFGSAWTPRYRHGGGDSHFTHCASHGQADCAFWERHWSKLEDAASATFNSASSSSSSSSSQNSSSDTSSSPPQLPPWILVTHGPPLERLDFVGKGALPVGDRHLMRRLSKMAFGESRAGTATATTASNGFGGGGAGSNETPLHPHNRAPLAHIFGHVHAQQHLEEREEGPRFVADSRHGKRTQDSVK